MINAATDPIKTTNQEENAGPVSAAPSFPTHNPAQQNRSFMTGSSLPPANPTTTSSDPLTDTSPEKPVSNSESPISHSNKSISTAPVVPAKPKFPDPTQTPLIKADGSITVEDGAGGGSGDDKNNSEKSKPKKKLNLKMAIGVIVLLFVVLGSGAGFYLTQQSQDLRQQASGCTEECPSGDGILRNCTPPEADGSPEESICNASFVGRVESCGGTQYCCPGTSWTTNMTACTVPTGPEACNDNCDANSECTSINTNWICDATSKKCRLSDNPTSATCEEAVALTCNDTCATDAECSDANADWSCDATSNKCRLTTNPTSITCEEAVALTCNDTCATDAECSDANADWSCDATSNKCRLTDNPTSITCETILSKRCEPCNNSLPPNTPNSKCEEGLVCKIEDNIVDDSGDIIATEVGGSGVCVAAEEEITACNSDQVACNDACTTDAECSDVNAGWSCDTTSSKCRLIANPTSITCEEAVATTPASCDDLTGTLTDGTTTSEDSKLTYSLTYSGDPVFQANLTLHGNFEGPGWTGDSWTPLDTDTTLTDGTLSGDTTFKEMADLLVATGHDREELLSTGIIYSANIYGPGGFCKSNGTLSGTGEACESNTNCIGAISLASNDGSLSCNDSCTVDSQCSDVNSNWFCEPTSDRCRLESNSISTSCAAKLPSNNNDATEAGCNEICITNSDCSNSNQICVTTSDGSNRCRLESYTNSTTCTITGSSGTQPSLPGSLPETGPENWLNWLKAGLTTLGIGTALFLLL